MLTEYHIEIMFVSLGDHLDTRALGVMTTANVRQDQICGQFGHDEFHFDNSAFAKTYSYIEEQRALRAVRNWRWTPQASGSAARV